MDERQPTVSRESLARDYGICGRLLTRGLWGPSGEGSKPDPGQPCSVLTSRPRRPLCGDPHPPSPPSPRPRLCPGLASCAFFLWSRGRGGGKQEWGGERGQLFRERPGGLTGLEGEPSGEPRSSTRRPRPRVQGANMLAAGPLGHEEGQRIKLRGAKGGHSTGPRWAS